MLTPPAHIHEIVNANRNTAGVIMGFMHLMKKDGDVVAVEGAAQDYLRLADHTMQVMACVFPGNISLGDRSRLPKGSPGSPEDYFELLDFAIEIEKINIERLLKDHPELSAETQDLMAGMAKDAVDVLGRYARWVRSAVQSRYPDLWTEIHEVKYKKYLDIRPLF
jgi:hypothetical protein